MATIGIAFGTWNPRMGLMETINQAENIESSGSSQTSSNTGTDADEVVEVATAGAIWVTRDGTTAAVGEGSFVPANTTRHFPAGFGTVIKVIDDS